MIVGMSDDGMFILAMGVDASLVEDGGCLYSRDDATLNKESDTQDELPVLRAV